LESVCWGNSTVGSNPTLSAIPPQPSLLVVLSISPISLISLAHELGAFGGSSSHRKQILAPGARTLSTRASGRKKKNSIRQQWHQSVDGY
jgi:hypothetical protein